MSLPVIVRKMGPYKRKWGILLSTLKPYQIKLLFDNPLISKSSADDQFLQIIFRLADMDICKKTNRKIYYNHYNDIVSDYDQILHDSQYIEWSCAICKVFIKSKISEFDIDNLICKECHKTHGSHNKFTTIDSRIVEHSIKFRKHCRSLLIKQQKGFMKYVNKFENEIHINP